MTTDTIVYDKNSTVTGIALLENGNPEELEIITGSQAISGNVYLGKISKKVMLAGDKEGFFVNLGNGLEGFLNAEENGCGWKLPPKSKTNTKWPSIWKRSKKT